MSPRPLHPLSFARRLLFAATALALGTVLSLALLEAGLRVAGFGHSTGFAVREKGRDGKISYTANPFFTRRFLSVRMPKPSPPTIPFRLGEKPPGTVRVFLLGSSAAYGVPDPAQSMARFLEILLSRQYPGVRFQVVNAAVPGMNSNAFLPMSQAILRDLSPDLLVLYMGHNEVTGPFGALSPVGHRQALVRIAGCLASTRVGQLARAIRRTLFAFQVKDVALRDEFEERLLSATRLPGSSPRLAGIRRLFSENLRDILSAAREAGVGVVLGTPACNLGDNAPFASVHGPDIGPEKIRALDEAMDKAAGLAAQGEFGQAALQYREAAALDPDFAEARFRLARCLEHLGEYGQALKEFKAARDADALRFRADGGMLNIIREAVGPGVALADVEKHLEAASPHGIPGSDLFFNHVHLRLRGNYVAALSILKAAGNLLPPAARASAGKIASLKECLEALPYSDRDRLEEAREMVKSAMGMLHRQASTHEDSLMTLQREVRDLEFAEGLPALMQARNSYEKVLAGSDASWIVHEKYAGLLLYGLKDLENAGFQAKKVLEEVTSPKSLLILAVAENGQGRHEEALEHLMILARLFPDHIQVRAQLFATRAVLAEKDGRRLLDLGREKEAQEKLNEAGKLWKMVGGYGVELPGGGK